MNKRIAILTVFCLFTMALAISAQDKKTNFAGVWELDLEKSQIEDRGNSIKSMTLKITQTAEELQVERTIERNEGLGRGGGGERMGGRRRQASGTMPLITYDLNGKKVKTKSEFGRNNGEVIRQAIFENDGKLKLKEDRVFETQRGTVQFKSTEIWELSKDGRTLTISIESETPRGDRKSKQVFTKSPMTIKGDNNTTNLDLLTDLPADIQGTSKTKSVAPIPKRISGGVVNGKTSSLPRPAYPPAALAANIKGSVQVRVIISKEGKVMEAEAVTGHPLLRKAAVEAAKKAEFAPTYLEGVVVEVSGIIVYNFQ